MSQQLKNTSLSRIIQSAIDGTLTDGSFREEISRIALPIAVKDGTGRSQMATLDTGNGR